MGDPLFEKTKYFIIDMDGTFYLDGNLIDGAMDFLTRVKELGKDFYFFTNNTFITYYIIKKELNQ